MSAIPAPSNDATTRRPRPARRRGPVLLLAGLAACATAALAQVKPQLAGGYPGKPIRVIVPASPGGGTDIVTRIVAQKLAERWGHPVVTENRSSAVGGVIGMDQAVRATPDGYTLLAVAASTVLNATLVNRPAYDPRKAFDPVVQLTAQPYVLAVTASLPAQSVGDLLTLARRQPGRLNFGSAGTGSMTHLGMELFKDMARVDIAHIPYKGMGPAIVDLLGGQVQVAIAGGLSTMTHVKNGRLRILGVSSLERSRLMPGYPTIAESGVPGYELSGWYAWLAPAGVPSAIVQALNREVVEIMKSPEVVEKLAGDGSEPAAGTPDALRARMNRDIERWTRLFERTRMKQ